MIDHETIVKIIMRECWGVTDDEDPGSVMPRIAGVAADAILAAIGTPDATGDALRKVVEDTWLVKSITIAYSPAMPHRWGVMIDHEGTSYTTGEGDTPIDAITAALAAAEAER